MVTNLKDRLSNRAAISPIATCTLKIRSHYNALSPGQKKLADYITASREELPPLNLKQLARKARVSSATVTRFCRAIGFAGFHEFKMASARELVSLPLVFEDFDPGDDDEARISKVFAAYIQSLIDTRAMLSVPNLVELADRIKQARQVSVFGIGSPGSSRITVDTIRLARKQGAFTVAITNHANSPLARAASLSLLTSLHEKKVHVASLTSRVAQVTLVDCLYITLAARNEKKFTTWAALIEKELREKFREFPRSAE